MILRLVTLIMLGWLLGDGAGAAEDLTARLIVEKATAAAGGDAWRLAETIHLLGHATLYRDGMAAMATHADRYEMFRVYPDSLAAAHAFTGKFRIDAYRGERLLFQASFDGERAYDQNGPQPPEAAARFASESFGFSAIRFALAEGFSLARMADDQVEGRACYFVRVQDPAGQRTLFGIDQRDFSVRSVAWDTPRGWHERIYSDFYWVEDPGFRQPGRVRLYYDGIKTVDIHWTSAAINEPLPDHIFRLGTDTGP